jgi:hypothetical protein
MNEKAAKEAATVMTSGATHRLIVVDLDRDLERVAGRYELRRAEASWQLATGTLACPECDAPVMPPTAGIAPADALSCPFCLHAGAVRDFLTLGEPTRPARVVVRVRGLAFR